MSGDTNERVTRWFESREASTLRGKRTTVLLQGFERDISNPHTRGSLLGLVYSVIALIMRDAYEAGLRDGAKPIADSYRTDPPICRDPQHRHTGPCEVYAAAQERLTPLEPQVPKSWVHGTRLGRDHKSVRQHLIEDHGMNPAIAEMWTDGAIHGHHDALHDTTWAYAANLPHDDDTRSEYR